MKINVICKSKIFTLEKFQSLFTDCVAESNEKYLSGYDIIIVDISQLKDMKSHYDSIKEYSEKIIFVSTSNTYNIKYACKILSTNTPPCHVVGLNNEDDMAHVKKIADCMINKTVISFDSMLSKSIHMAEIKVDNSTNISKIIRDTLSQFDFEDCFSAIKDSLGQLINELLYNALFNAPTDKDGNQTFKEQDRKVNIRLDIKNSADLKITNNEKEICISVVDKYGSITKDVIDSHISRSKVTEKKGGAGIGLSLIYNNSHELIFIVSPGEKTEVISVIHKYKRYKNNMKHVRSFHFFVKGKQ
jgi:hypothetical protein